MSKKIRVPDTLAKWVVADVLAEAVVTFVKVFVVLLVLANGVPGIPNRLAASAVLGLLTYVGISTFGINMHIVTDPVVSIILFVINAIWSGNSDNKEFPRASIGNIVSIVLRTIINIVVSALTGFFFTKTANGILPLVFLPQNVLPGYHQGWAIAMTFFILLVGFHYAVFLLIFQSDGFGSSLSVGITYGVISFATSMLTNVYLDYSISIGIAVAARDFGMLSGIMLGVLLLAAVVTLVLYWLLWDMFMSADVLRQKKTKDVINDINGSFHNNDLEDGNGGVSVPSKGRNNINQGAYDALKNM